MTKASILVVEDEQITAMGIVSQLKRLGFACSGTAATGESGVEMAVALRPDLVLMDIQLGPGMDGVAAAEKIRKQLAIPVIFLTAHSDPETLERAQISQPYGYILKPFEDRQLLTSIQIVLHRHRLEQGLRDSQKQLALTLSSLGDGLIAFDTQGTVRLMNAMAEQLTGWSQEEALGKPITQVFRLINSTTGEAIVKSFVDVIRQGKPQEMPEKAALLTRNGGAFPVEDSLTPMFGLEQQVTGGVILFRDATQRLVLEEMRLRNQRLEAVGQLSGGIAHHFNNLLTVINGYAEMLLLGSPSVQDNRGYAEQILLAGQKAAHLTQEILAFGQSQFLQPQVIVVDDFLRKKGPWLQEILGLQIDLTLELACPASQVYLDADKFTLTLKEIVANARDAMPNGGRLTLASSSLQVDRNHLPPCQGLLPGSHVQIRATDTGEGMTPDVLTRAFEPFFTTRGVGQATGLGLAAIHGFVEQSGGRVDLSSTPGKGTTLRLFFPSHEEGKVPLPIDVPQRPMQDAKTILIIEEEGIRYLLTKYLQHCGFEVIQAASAAQAVELVQQYGRPIHLAIVELSESLAYPPQWRETLGISPSSSTQTLYLSAYSREVLQDRGVNTRDLIIMTKPFRMEAFSALIHKLLEKS